MCEGTRVMRSREKRDSQMRLPCRPFNESGKIDRKGINCDGSVHQTYPEAILAP